MPTVEERLASLEARVDAMAGLRTAITDLRDDTNRQFTDLRSDMNRQFADVRGDSNRQFIDLRGDMNRRFIEMRGDVKALDQKVDRQFIWLVGTQLALLLAVVGALLGAYYR